MVNLNTNSVGVDHTVTSVDAARARSLETYTVDEFQTSTTARPKTFDDLLLAHVLEHLNYDAYLLLLGDFLITRCPCRIVASVRPGDGFEL